MNVIETILPAIIKRYPDVIPHLGGWFFKSYDFYLRTLQNMVRNVYDGYMGGEFRTILNNLILGQLSTAYEEAARDNGLMEVTPQMFESMMNMVTSERSHVDDFYRAIVDARTDKTPVEPLLTRAELWANRYNDAYKEAVRVLTLEQGGKLMWVLGATEKHCWICKAFNGKVAFAHEWETAGIRPQNPPNPILSLSNGDEKGCGGWRCDCSLVPTDKRRSPKALDVLLAIVTKI